MTYADMFSEVKGMLAGADVSDIQEHLAYQFNIIGEAEGIFYAEVKEGKLYIEPYEYFAPRTPCLSWPRARPTLCWPLPPAS